MFEKPCLRKHNLPQHWLEYSQKIEKPKSWLSRCTGGCYWPFRRKFKYAKLTMIPRADMNMYTSWQGSNQSTILYMYKAFQLKLSHIFRFKFHWENSVYLKTIAVIISKISSRLCWYIILYLFCLTWKVDLLISPLLCVHESITKVTACWFHTCVC